MQQRKKLITAVAIRDDRTLSQTATTTVSLPCTRVHKQSYNAAVCHPLSLVLHDVDTELYYVAVLQELLTALLASVTEPLVIDKRAVAALRVSKIHLKQAKDIGLLATLSSGC